MASEQNIDPETVAWIPPEQLDKAYGEYRIVEGQDPETLETKWGAKVVHISIGTEGKFRHEEYDQTRHGKPYRPQLREEDLSDA